MKTLKKVFFQLAALCLIVSVCSCSSDSDDVVLSSDAIIESLSLGEFKGEIKEDVINLALNSEIDIKNVILEIKVSKGATIDSKFKESVDLTKVQEIIVTAEDGKNKKTYSLKVRYLNSDAYIRDFIIEMEEVKVNIDDEKLVINLSFPSTFLEENIAPVIAVNEASKVLPESGQSVSLKDLSYTVTAEDGTTRIYKVLYEVRAEVKEGSFTLDEIKGRWRVKDFNVIALCTPKELVEPMSEYFTDKIRGGYDKDNILRGNVSIVGNSITVQDGMRKGESGSFVIDNDFLVSENKRLGFNGRMKITRVSDKEITLNVGPSIIDEMMYFGYFMSYFRVKNIDTPANFEPGKILIVLHLNK